MKAYTNEFSFILKPSLIENGGVGVFAVHGIKAGTRLELYDKNSVSRVVDASEIPEALRHYCIFLPDNKVVAPKKFNHMWITWYLNHSNNPNITLDNNEDCYYALKDIQENEELLVDYNQFDEPEDKKADYYK